jgi:inorganic pyrophosphatase
MNYLHDIEPGKEDSINVIIEIPRGSKNKYEIDKETGLIALDRVLHTAQEYPFDYGFVPQTHWHDGDALDVVVLATNPIPSGILVRVKPLGLMDMVDNGDPDGKIIATPIDDPRWSDVNDLKDINSHTLKEIEHFFCTYKQLEGKICEISGFYGKQKAIDAFKEGIELYRRMSEGKAKPSA